MTEREQVSYPLEISFVVDVRNRTRRANIVPTNAIAWRSAHPAGRRISGVRCLLVLQHRLDRILAFANEGEITVPKSMEHQVEQAILFAIFFLPPAVLLLLAGLGFLYLRRRGWLLASVAQGLTCLQACSIIPTRDQGFFTYPIIAYCILLVLYLNSQGVRAAAQSKGTMLVSRGLETTRGG